MDACAPSDVESPETFLQSIGIDPGRWAQPDMPSAEVLLERLIGLEDLGFTADGALAAVEKYPNLLGLTTEKVASSISHLLSYGFTPEDVRKCIIRWGTIVNFTPERVDAVWANLEAYGFSRVQVRRMIRHVPAILCYTPERTNRLLANLEAAGHDHELVIRIVHGLPGILCMTAEHTNACLAALRDARLELPSASKLLTRAPYVLRGRIAFLRTRGADVNLEQVGSSHAEFLKRWGVTRDDVIAMDPLGSDQKTAPTE